MTCEEYLLELRNRENHTRVILPGETVAFDGEGRVFFRAPPYSALRVELAPDIDSVRFVSGRGRVPENSQAILPLFHGTGAPYSHSGAMLSTLNTLTAGPTERRRGFVYELQQRPEHLFVAAEAVDLPGHGGGPDLARFQTVDAVVDWLASEFQALKRFGLPIIPITRSGAGGLLVVMNRKYPGLVDGMILMSPLHPCGVQHSNDYLEGCARLPSDHPDFVTIRREAFDWINGLYRQIIAQNLWPEGRATFGSTPTMILVGRADEQLSVDARRTYATLAMPEEALATPEGIAEAGRAAEEADGHVVLSHGNIRYVQVAGAGHDVFENRNRESAARAQWVYAEAYRFIRDVIGRPASQR